MTRNHFKATATFITGFALVAALTSPLTLATDSASAAQCTLTTDSQSGIACGDPSGAGSIGTPGNGTPTASIPGGCSYSADPGDLPDSFWSFTGDQYTDWTFERPHGRSVTRVYTDPAGERTGLVNIDEDYASRTYTMWAWNTSIPGVRQVAGMDCMKSANGWSWAVTNDSHEDVTLPKAPRVTEKALINASIVIAPLPGKTNEYLLRIDVTNSSAAAADAIVVFSNRNWSSVRQLSDPSDMLCGVQNGVEQCHLQSIDPGTADILVFDVSMSDVSAASEPIDVIGTGYTQWKWSTARPSGWTPAPALTDILVERP
ncbi:hypothetical protein [Subtercola sp. YIM 133946]|uniref:hypothetical protein n=1 Tax=Subtercola sp. YIM 133946 TaxID=3118909 RepID=UPI002F94E5C8